MRDFEEVLAVLCMFVVGVVGALLLATRFLWSLQRVLGRVRPENRRMEPDRVWLNLVPVFNFVWATVTVVMVAESLRNEYRARGLDGPGENYGRTPGLWLLSLLASGCLFYPAFLTYPAALVVWITYWSRMNRYAHELKTGEFRAAAAAPAAEFDEGW
jgi:hypothetical protein